MSEPCLCFVQERNFGHFPTEHLLERINKFPTQKSVFKLLGFVWDLRAGLDFCLGIGI